MIVINIHIGLLSVMAITTVYYITVLLCVLFLLLFLVFSVVLLSVHTTLQERYRKLDKELESDDLIRVVRLLENSKTELLNFNSYAAFDENEHNTMLAFSHKLMNGIKGKHYFFKFVIFDSIPTPAQKIKETLRLEQQVLENDLLELEDASSLLAKSNIFADSTHQGKALAYIRIDEFCKGKFKLHFFSRNVVCVFLRKSKNKPERYPRKIVAANGNSVFTPFKFDLHVGDLLFFIVSNSVNDLFISKLLDRLVGIDTVNMPRMDQLITDSEHHKNIDSKEGAFGCAYLGIQI